MKKNIIRMLAVLFASILLVSCSGKVENQGSNKENVLDIYIFKAGFDVDWLYAIREEFLKESWVKDKFGDITINVTTNDVKTYAVDRIKNGDATDLYFAHHLRTLFLEDYKRKPVLEDFSSVLESNVPGENIKFKDKMLKTAYDSTQFINAKGEKKVYAMPMSGSMNGIYYNENILNELNIKVPLTTDELASACDKIAEKKGYAIMSSATEAPYWNYLYSTFWGQYDGYDKYVEYFEGKVNGELGKTGVDVLENSPGILKSLEALEKILSGNHIIDTANSLLFMQAQTNFIKGDGAFMANGDWFDKEMYYERQQRLEAGQKLPTLTMMRTPVISSIVEKLDYRDNGRYMSDEMLSSIIKEIDSEKEKSDNVNVSLKDYNTILEARRIVHTSGYGSNVVIPSYTPAKELAKGFISYLATDKAQEIYAEKTEGSQLPFIYDLKSKNEKLYNKIPTTGKMRFDFYSKNEKFSSNLLPSEYQFPLMIYAAYGTIMGNNATFEIFFSPGPEHKSAQSLYDDAKKYWSSYPNRWNEALSSAMLI